MTTKLNEKDDMKKITAKLLLITSMLLTSTASNAAPNAWSGWYPVGQVYSYSTGSIFISTIPSSAHPNPAGCASSSWLQIQKDQPNIKEMYQMALTAQASGLRINAYISGTECVGSYPKLVHLRTVK